MKDTIEVKVTDNSAQVKQALQEAVERGLEAIGLVAEGHAKELCPVDTGRLRNSISHATDGEAVYIGTNVEYAPYVELGTSRMKARPYLRPAAENFGDEYRALMEQAMKSGGR